MLKKFGNYNVVPGWNENCKMTHETAHNALLCGVQRENQDLVHDLVQVFYYMSRTKPQFKRCLRNCKANENKCRADALARKLLSKDGGDFWKGINTNSCGKCMILSDKVDDVTGQRNIVNTWFTH